MGGGGGGGGGRVGDEGVEWKGRGWKGAKKRYEARGIGDVKRSSGLLAMLCYAMICYDMLCYAMI